jgi:V/A-type H+-transporting ATPase subunit E
MSNLENLTQRIIEDAKKEAEEIKKEADEKSKNIIESKVSLAQNEANKVLDKSKQEAVLIKERAISAAKLKSRDEELKAKQDILDRVFEMAKLELKNLDDDRYEKLLTEAIKETKEGSNVTIMLPEGKKNLASKLNRDISVEIDNTLDGGFIIKEDNVYYNFTFDSMINGIREELETEIASILFKREE